MKRWNGEIKIAEPDKCDGLLWADAENLPENTVDYVLAAIGNYLENKLFTVFGWSE